jgi:hypothetical protein
MDRKLFALGGLAAGLGIVLFLSVLWQPERQVRLHQRHFLEAVENRNWDRIARFTADNYSDRWGHDKTFLLTRGQEVFRHFVFLTIQTEERGLSLENGVGTVTERMKFVGNGSPLVPMITDQVNGLSQPFTFRWQARSWKPWDWQLLEVNQPQLVIRDSY